MELQEFLEAGSTSSVKVPINNSDEFFKFVPKGNNIGSPSNPTEIRIIESKPMDSGSVNLSVTVNKGTQMSDDWIECTWHHVQDGRTMFPVPSDIHNAFRHTGGKAIIERGLQDIFTY